MSNGILIFKGMKVGILAGDLVISCNENADQNSKLILSTAYNVIPVWLRIAADSCKHAKIASNQIVEKWNENEEGRTELLISELGPSLQVFVACGIVLDALHETLRPHTNISEIEIEKWKQNRTSRAKQIAEIIRRCFKLNGKISTDIRKVIIEIIKYRDLAVHPSLELKNACVRPDIPVGVDWKFATYRFSNAEWCLTNTVNIIAYLFEHKSLNSIVDESIQNIVDALIELKIVKYNA